MSGPKLTGLRRSMVLASLREPRSGHYIVQDVCDLRHTVDPDRLRRAWAEVAGRHGALRSRVAFTTAGEPCLEATEAQPAWEFLDWRDFPESECDAALERVLRQQFACGFDLARDPGVPYRFTLIQNRDDWWTIIWCSHHVLLDGRSYLRVWRDWMSAYDGGRLPEQVDGPASSEPIAAEVIPADLAFWQSELDGLDPAAGTLRDPLRAAGCSEPLFEPGREIRELSEEASAKLHAFGVRMSTVVSAAWALLLSRQGQRDDVLFGVTSSGRRSEDQRVGYFIRTFPFRLRFNVRRTLGEFLEYSEDTMLRARAQEHVPLNEIFASTAERPFDTLVAYDHQTPGEAFGALDPRRSLRRVQRTDMPLTLAAYGGGSRLRFEIVYSRVAYSPVMASSVADQLETLLHGWAESNPETPLQTLTFLPERQRIWLRQVSTGPEVPVEARLAHELIEVRARTQPDAPAIEVRNGRIVTYRELNAQTNRLAWRLMRDHHVGKGDVVAVIMPRGAEAVLGTIAVLKTGAACLPLDPAQPEARLRVMLDSANPRLVLREGDAWANDPDGLPEDSNPGLDVDPESIAYLIFTSGTTGTPKAVALPHRALVNHSLAVAPVYGIHPGDRRLQFASPGADVFFAEVFIYLSAGACLVCGLEPGPPTFEAFTRALAAHRITITGIPASWWKEWMRSTGASSALPPSLRAMICGMERLDASALEQWRRVSGGQVRLFNAYGPAENSPTSLIYEFGSSAWEDDHWAPVGKPIANTTAYLLDLAGEDMVPIGVTGEIYLGGPGLAQGYLGEDGGNRRFLDHRMFGRLYRTGDLGFRLPDGNIVFLGRRDAQIKVRGHRMEPEEVEAALRKHPAVREAAVALHPESGELMAWLTRNAGTSAPALHELRGHCTRLLPKAMVPAGFAMVDEMPRGVGGKLDRSALPRVPATRLVAAVEFREPVTAEQMQLADIWQSILRVERAGLDDDFFDLGGDSLASTMLIAAIASSFGVSLDMPGILRKSRLADMAQLCAAPVPQAGGDSLIALQSRGQSRPIVAICATEEDLHAFRNLAGHLPAGQPLYLLNCPVNPEGSVETIGKLAERAVRLIEGDSLSTRPYLLAGFCFAGIVAFETARQLDPLRRPNELLFFDVFRPGASGVAFQDPRGLLLKSVSAFSLRDLPSHLRFAAGLVRRRLRARSDAMTVAAGGDLAPSGDGGLLNWLERSAAMYQPDASAVPVTQFVSRDFEITTRVFEDPRLTWRSLCAAGFRVHEVPGAHGTLFQGRNAAALAEELLRVLDVDSRLNPPPRSLP